MNASISNRECERQVDLTRERADEITKEFRKNTLPRGFRLDDEGVWFQSEPNASGEFPPPIYVCSPLEVVAIVRDYANENHGRLLEFRDVDECLHSWSMPMEMLAGDGTKCREELLNRGLLIGSGRKPKELLMQYIQLCHPIARARCVLQTGWIENSFVLPHTTVGPLQYEKLIYQSPSSYHFGYAQAQELEHWKKIAALCQGNSRLVFSVSAAFASSLLALVGEENGGFHFRGLSSIGKSTCLKVAGSVWGSPKYLQSWRATANGLEGIAVAHNDTLLCLDEIEQMHPTEIAEVAYMLPNGCGKGRSSQHGTARKRSVWRLLFLSTGEISLAAHIQQGGRKARAGHEVRIIDIPADTGKYGLFEQLHGFENGSTFANHLIEACQHSYGTASIHFLKELIRNRDSSLEMVKMIREKLRVRELPTHASGQVMRGFHRFSLVAAAGELATALGCTGWAVGEADIAAMKCFDDWLKSRGDAGLSEEKVALSQVRKFFGLHGESRFSAWGANPMENKTINRAGFKKFTHNGIEFYVFTEIFKTEICSGLDPVFVAKVCIQHGLLQPSSDGNPTRPERLPGNNGGTTRCYRFTSKVIEN